MEKILYMDDFTKHLKESLKNKVFKKKYNSKQLRYKTIDTLIGIKVRRLGLITKPKPHKP